MQPITAEMLLCPCCHTGQPDQRLIASLNHLQNDLGTQLQINSGCRCPKHNADVGGAPNSKHLSGIAADITAAGRSPLELYLAADQQPLFHDGGIGLYPLDFIHIDVRRERARWYRQASQDHPITDYLHHADAS
jgi:uncharacterized protein YcbK (DUF882 family)